MRVTIMSISPARIGSPISAGEGPGIAGSSRKRHISATALTHAAAFLVDQNKVPNNLPVNEPSVPIQGIGGRSGR
jgi:hypothetical protein